MRERSDKVKVNKESARQPHSGRGKPKNRAHSKAGANLIFGLHSALSRVERAPDTILSALIDGTNSNARLDEVLQALLAAHINVEKVTRKELDAVSSNGNHQGVVLTIAPMQMPHEKDLPSELKKLTSPFILVLDQITDPHNLGACIRTADGAGVDMVIAPKDGACPMTETVHRVASGATDSMPVYYVTNLARTLRLIKELDIWVVGLADASSSPIGTSNFPASVAFVMGAEGAGLRRLTQEQCDELVSIPMHGSVSSLNVSVATGVVLYSHKAAMMR